MKEILERRLGLLREESEAGHRLYAELKARQDALAEKLLRISGAIQVLEETLADHAAADQEGDTPVSLVAHGP